MKVRAKTRLEMFVATATCWTLVQLIARSPPSLSPACAQHASLNILPSSRPAFSTPTVDVRFCICATSHLLRGSSAWWWFRSVLLRGIFRGCPIVFLSFVYVVCRALFQLRRGCACPAEPAHSFSCRGDGALWRLHRVLGARCQPGCSAKRPASWAVATACTGLPAAATAVSAAAAAISPATASGAAGFAGDLASACASLPSGCIRACPRPVSVFWAVLGVGSAS